MATKVVIDAGHGGEDFGATYNGIDVEYTRVEDVYDTPFQKAQKGNAADADFFISLHRNATENPGADSGIQTLVFDDTGIKAQMARNINFEIVDLGFRDLGVVERPNLVVLKRTKMPAVLVETGFIDNPSDNAKFDEQFDEIAAAIAGGILDTIYANQ